MPTEPTTETLPVPEVDRAGIARLATEAEAASARRKAPDASDSSLNGLTPIRSQLTPTSGQAPSVRGLKEPKCPDCGETIPTSLVDICNWLGVWNPEAHQCPERTAREVREREEQAEKERQWRDNPPEGRIREVFSRVRLPADTPPGLRLIRYEEVDHRLIDAVAAHQATWLKGIRPEKGLWVCGPTNKRKTIVVSALAFDVAHRTPRSVLFWNMSDLMAHIRRAAQGKDNEYEPHAISNADKLVIDDLGTMKLTERAWDEIFHMIESAKSGWGETKRHQTLYVTSNENPESMIDRLSPPGDPTGGERIVRRLRQICDLVEVGL